MKSIEVTGKNVEQAIEIGLFKLNATREQVKISVIDEGGLFDKAKIRMGLVSESEAENPVLKTVEDIVNKMGLSCETFLEETDDSYVVNLSGEDVGSVIGKRGDVLDSLQYLVSLIVNKGKHGDEYKRVIVDSEGYRNRRIETLKALANRMANEAIRKGRRVDLEPMSASERRVIHTELQNNPDVTTESKGVEPRRFLTITPKNTQKKSTYISKNVYDTTGKITEIEPLNNDNSKNTDGREYND